MKNSYSVLFAGRSGSNLRASTSYYRLLSTVSPEGFVNVDVPGAFTRTFKGIIFTALIDADVFSKLASQNEDKIKDAKKCIFNFYNNCWNVEFGTNVSFTSSEHAGKIVGATKEGKAWNAFYRREYSFFMSSHEQFAHLGLERHEIEAFKKDALAFSEVKKRVSIAQTQLSKRHEEERKQLVAQLYDHVKTKNKFLGIMMVSEENLSVKQQMELLGIVDQKVREATAKRMVLEKQKQVLEDLKKGIPDYFPDLFGL